MDRLLLEYVETVYEALTRRCHPLNRWVADSYCDRIVVFGGWIRDRVTEYVHQRPIESNDLDLVFQGGRLSSIEQWDRTTRFGGLTKHLECGLKVDVWPLENTHSFRMGLKRCSFANLPSTTVFDVNSMTWDPASGALFSRGAVSAIRNAKVGFKCTEYLWEWPELQACRAVWMADKLNFELSTDVRAFLVDVLRRKGGASRVVSEVSRSREGVDIERTSELLLRHSRR